MSFFNHKTRLDLSDGSKRSIYQVRVGDEVMGVDAQMRVVPTQVTGVGTARALDGWTHIRGQRISAGRGSSYGALWTHRDQAVWVIGQGEYLRADSLAENQEMMMMRSELKLTPMQRSVLLGKILGDGYLRAHASGAWNVSWSHREEDAEYTHWVALACGEMASGVDYPISGYGSQMVRANTVRSPWIRQEFQHYIEDGGVNKIVPESVVSDLDPIALAFWYMDDGSLSHSEGQEDRCNIATSGFSEEENERLRRALLKLNIESRILWSHRGTKSYPYLSIRTESAERLFLLVAPYVPPSMQRKLPERYRGGPGWLPRDVTSRYHPMVVPMRVLAVRQRPDPEISKAGYWVATEAGNFFANSTLVGCATS